MLRTRSMTIDAVLQPLGSLALLTAAIPLFAALGVAIAAAAIVLGAMFAFDWLHRQRLLAPLALGALLGLVVIHFAGCAAVGQRPVDPRDPAVWRPTAPARHPLPR